MYRLFALIRKVAIICIDMSDLQPENFPHASGHMDEFVIDPADMIPLIEERTTRIKQFFSTEFGAYSVLQHVTEAQEKMDGKPLVHDNSSGLWRQYPAIDYNPDYADSSRRRFLNVTLHTSNLGTYPILAVRAELNANPVEYYDRRELLIARFALKGQFLKINDNDVVPMFHTLMGPPSEESKAMIKRQQRYAQWAAVAAYATGISIVKRSPPFTLPNSSCDN